LGESDEKPFRPTDVAEPIRVRTVEGAIVAAIVTTVRRFR
jgi:hypothetical protein